MKSNLLEAEPGLVLAISASFPGRIIERGPITFLGPYTNQEVNQTRKSLGLKPKPKQPEGHYFGLVDTSAASHEELMEVFATFLKDFIYK